MDTTVVVPCYNEEHRLPAERFIDRPASEAPVRFLFVDDGSTDATRARIEALRDRAPARFEVLALPHNVGKAEAVRQGMLQCFERGDDVVGMWDADLATPLEEVGRMLEFLAADGDTDIVLGSRVRLLGRQIRRRPLRHYAGRGFATLASLTLGLPVYDTQCGAKLFRAVDPVRRAVSHPFRAGWVFDVELLARYLHEARRAGITTPEARLVEVPLQSWEDVGGSKIGTGDGVRALLALARIRREYPPFRD